MRAESDKYKPDIYCMALSPDGHTVAMTDYNNNNIKIISTKLKNNPIVSVIQLDSMPYGLVFVSEDQLAVTPNYFDRQYVWIVNLKKGASQGDTVNKIQTDRSYNGIAVVHEDNTARLVVGCSRDYYDNKPASVDIISMSGKKVRTLVSSNTLAGLYKPRYLSRHNDTIFVSDSGSHCVFVVSLVTGSVLHTITHTQMKFPQQVCVGGGGTLLVASELSRCVLACPAGEGGRGARAAARGPTWGGVVCVSSGCLCH
jgi:hypothetical protein